MFSLSLKKENQSTKWGRFSINYDLLEQVIMAKELKDGLALVQQETKEKNEKPKLKVKTVIAF